MNGKIVTFGSLFASIGGFDLGFERAGMQCVWQVEIGDVCNVILERYWPGVASNAVTVNVAEWIGRRIVEVDNAC